MNNLPKQRSGNIGGLTKEQRINAIDKLAKKLEDFIKEYKQIYSFGMIPRVDDVAIVFSLGCALARMKTIVSGVKNIDSRYESML